jgi:hypothetical protein
MSQNGRPAVTSRANVNLRGEALRFLTHALGSNGQHGETYRE